MTDVLNGSNLGGGPFKGFMPKQTSTTLRDSEQAQTRRLIRGAWNNQAATGVINNYGRRIGPFRAVNNSGDFLNRQNFVCGGPNPIQPDNVSWRSRMGSIRNSCDATGVVASSCNPKFVPDSSDYIRFKKQQVTNQLYNDLSTVGDKHNGSYVALMAIRRI